MYCRLLQLRNLTLIFCILLFVGKMVFAQDFSKGIWIKTYIPKDGLHVLSYDWFIKNKINLSTLSVQKIAIYQDQRGLKDSLQWQINPKQLNQLIQVPTIGIGLEDDSFDKTDKLFFPIIASQTPESDSTFCLINLGGENSIFAKKISQAASTGVENFGYQEEIFHEEKYNYLQSGQLWVSEPIYSGETKTISFAIKDLATQKAYFTSQLFASSIQDSQLLIKSTNFSQSVSFQAISGDRYDRKADAKFFSYEFTPASNSNKIEFQFQFNSKIGSANIGTCILLYPRILTASDNFWSQWPKSQSNESPKTLQISGVNQDSQAWLFTSNNQFELLDVSNNLIMVQQPAKSKLLLADSKLAFEPIFLENIQPFSNNLQKNTELVIIYPKAFESAALKFANYKNQQQIPSEIRSLENILTEYASGKLSLPAIKSFLYQQKKVQNTKLNYVVLLSDASVDVKEKNNLGALPTRKIPTYESSESLYPLSSYASDDYLGILSDTLGIWDQQVDKKLDIELSIGRLPAKSLEEAHLMVNKIIYASSQTRKNTGIGFIADDEDFNIHLLDAEDFAKRWTENAPQFPIQKVYLDAFPMNISNGIYVCPDANKKINSLFMHDAGFIHFMGHGSESGWTDEKIFTINDIVNLRNTENLPILLTATCQFAKLDNPYILSGAEVLLSSDKGGAQAIIGTSRPVFQSNNYLFGKTLYSLIFKNLNNSSFRLGDLVKETKNMANVGVGNRNIYLLGDPSASLPWTGKPLNLRTENFTWGAESKINIEKKQEEKIGGYISIFGENEYQETLGTKSPKFSFKPENSLLYQKEINLEQNSTTIRIPAIKKNNFSTINYRFQGKSTTGNYWGFTTNKAVIGTYLSKDIEGPSIQQVETGKNQFILSDSSGIGLVDAKGNRSIISINENLEIPIQQVVTKFDHDNLWTLSIDQNILEQSTNTLRFYVSDLLQNVTEKTFTISRDQTNSSNLVVYPNPFFEQLSIEITDRNSWTIYQYQALIYTLNGQLVKEIEGSLPAETLHIPLHLNTKSSKYLLVFKIIDPINRSSKTYLKSIISAN